MAALTGIAVLLTLLAACSRYLSGTPKKGGRKGKLVFALVLAVLWLGVGVLLWLQRPREVDTFTIADSPDQQYSAKVVT